MRSPVVRGIVHAEPGIPYGVPGLCAYYGVNMFRARYVLKLMRHGVPLITPFQNRSEAMELCRELIGNNKALAVQLVPGENIWLYRIDWIDVTPKEKAKACKECKEFGIPDGVCLCED